LALVLTGCQFRPNILSASSHRVGNEVAVQVTLHSVDAKSIKNRQLHFSLVVVNCTGESDRYPAEARIDGQRADEFQFPVDGDTVEMEGRVPAQIFGRYSRPCVLLEGGGYLTGTIRSSMTPIIDDTGAGSDNPFKPNPLRGPTYFRR
jgi:hypothetical protein